MTASTHWLATACAQAVLERGGNAFDAACAGGFVLQVVEPHLNGPGGDLVCLSAAVGQEPEVLVGQGPAPRGASIEHFHGQGLRTVPGSGALAAAVPGAVPAWLDLLERKGTWELADVLAYAVHYARVGFPASWQLARTVSAVAGLFREHWPASAAQWLPEDRDLREGDVVRNEAWARTLESMADAGAGAGTRSARIAGAAAHWRGPVAAAVAAGVRAPHRHASGTDHAGVLEPRDFAELRIRTEPAHSLDFRGTTVVKAGTWSQGPVLLQTLAILAHVPEPCLDLTTAVGVHTVVEALKLALADRDAYYGDADVPAAELAHPAAADGARADLAAADGVRRAVLAELLSDDYGRSRALLIGSEASHEWRPGTITSARAYRPELRTPAGTAAVPEVGEPTVGVLGATRGDTCHLDVVDRDGNMVSATPSGGWLQSSPYLPAVGFCLGTRLQMTWLDPSAPSALVPGRRPRTTLSPTLLLRGGTAVGALGTPGGDQQDQWQLLYLLRTLVAGMAPQPAIDAPAFHTTSLVSSFWPRSYDPGGLVVEDRLGDGLIAALVARGHRVTRAGDWSLGRLSVVLRDPGTGRLQAAANPRGGQGRASGR